jgi:hypothetical protein
MFLFLHTFNTRMCRRCFFALTSDKRTDKPRIFFNKNNADHVQRSFLIGVVFSDGDIFSRDLTFLVLFKKKTIFLHTFSNRA